MKQAIVLAALILSGCQDNPYAHEFTRQRPSEASLAGRYRLDAETIALMRTETNLDLSRECMLILNSDKTFVAREMPRCFIDTVNCERGTDEWKGTWTLQQRQDWWAVGLLITSRNGKATSYALPAMLRGAAAPYLVHLTIGDPDAGNAVAFERDSSESR